MEERIEILESKIADLEAMLTALINVFAEDLSGRSFNQSSFDIQSSIYERAATHRKESEH